MADLSFLFNKYEPTGMMGGVQQGMTNAKTLADIGHTSTATDRMAFDTEQARLYAPYDLQVKQLAGMNAQADMSPEAQRIRSDMQGAELEQKQLGNQKSRLDINANQMKAYLEQTAGVFNHIAQQASMGVPVENILGQIDQMVTNLSPEQQQQWKQQRAQYAGMAPQQVAQQAKTLAQHLLNSNPEHLSKMAVESMRLQGDRIKAGASGSNQKYNIEQALTKATNDMLSIKQQLDKHIAAGQGNDPRVKELMNAYGHAKRAVKQYENLLSGKLSSTQTYSPDGTGVTKQSGLGRYKTSDGQEVVKLK